MPTKSLQPITKTGETWSYAKIENREISLFVSAKQKKKRRLINPAGTIQSLKCSLFKEAFYINDDDPSVNNLLTDTQVKSYKIYKQSEEDEAL
jgi:hypothetical protein